jgi:predicted nucleic acid-binding protein
VIVIDASVLVGVILRPRRATAARERIFRAGERLCAPHLIDVEFVSALRRFTLRGEVDVERARASLLAYRALTIRRFDHRPLLDRVFGLRHNYSAYDATYVALAESLAASLVTSDSRLGNAPNLNVSIEYLPS